MRWWRLFQTHEFVNEIPLCLLPVSRDPAVSGQTPAVSLSSRASCSALLRDCRAGSAVTRREAGEAVQRSISTLRRGDARATAAQVAEVAPGGLAPGWR